MTGKRSFPWSFLLPRYPGKMQLDLYFKGKGYSTLPFSDVSTGILTVKKTVKTFHKKTYCIPIRIKICKYVII